MSRCEGCQYWSEMIAQAMSGGPVEAMCLNEQSPHRNKMVYRGCEKFEAGLPLDHPALMAQRN